MTVPDHLLKALQILVIVALVEGAIAKWISPALGSFLPYFRDILTAWIFFRILYLRLSLPELFLIKLIGIYSVFVVFYGCLQYLVNQESIVVLFVGLRFWLMPVMLIFVVFVCCVRTDGRVLYDIFRVSLLPMAVLVTIQHFSPRGSIWNIQPNTLDESKIFVIAGNIVRATGTFTFTFGFTCYLLVAICILLFPVEFKINSKYRSRSGVAVDLDKYIMLFIVMAMCLFSGSRAMLAVGVAIVFLWSLSGGGIASVGGGISVARFVAPVSLIIAVNLLLILLPDSFGAIESRIDAANRSEDTSSRLSTIFFGEPAVRDKFSYLGEGIGMGSNAATLLTSGQRYFALAESEPGRILLEAGVFGAIVIAVKFAVLLILACIAVLRARIVNFWSSLAWIIAVSVAWMTWPVSGQIHANFFAALLTGYALHFIFYNKGRM